MLCLDTDMRFPPDTLRRLLLHNKAFVAANCVTKRIPAEPTAKTVDGTPVFTDSRKKGLEAVGHVGIAVALLQTKSLLGMEGPNFPFPWQEEEKAYGGEDGFFCKKWREHTGLQIWIDHDLSKAVGHIGSFTYDWRVVGSVVKQEVA
jgi:hypothetical protein